MARETVPTGMGKQATQKGKGKKRGAVGGCGFAGARCVIVEVFCKVSSGDAQKKVASPNWNAQVQL